MRTPSKGTLHERLVESLVATHQAGRVGFSAAVRKHLGAVRRNEENEHIFSYFREWRLIPDAFRIDAGDPTVVNAWEVEVSHRLSMEKLEQYVDLMWFLDSEYLAFRLIVVNHHGTQSEIDLVAWSCGAPMTKEISDHLAFCHAPALAGVPKVVPISTPSWREDG